jgi:hypothetical protein
LFSDFLSFILTPNTVTVTVVTDRGDTVDFGKEEFPDKERNQAMLCNKTNTNRKVNSLVVYTVLGTLAAPLIAALFVPAVYLPLVGLIVPFVAAGFLDHKVEALDCAA